jgi:hypothetical protein
MKSLRAVKAALACQKQADTLVRRAVANAFRKGDVVVFDDIDGEGERGVIMRRKRGVVVRTSGSSVTVHVQETIQRSVEASYVLRVIARGHRRA